MLGKVTSLSVCILVALSSAQASVLFSDDFAYPEGPLVMVSSGRWKTHSGTAGQVEVASGHIKLSLKNSEDVSAPFLEGAVIGLTNSAALYASLRINFMALPSGANGSYFAHFKDASATTGFRCRVFATTNGAAVGSYRLGIAAAASTPSEILAQDLTLNVTYSVVCRLDSSNSVSTLWLNPNAETDRHVTSTDTATPKLVSAFAFRESLVSGAGMGELTVDDLIVATSFADLGLAAQPCLPPLVVSVQTGGAVVLRWPAAPDQTYSVWAADGVPSEFTQLGSGLSFADGNGGFQDHPGAAPMRFYRISAP